MVIGTGVLILYGLPFISVSNSLYLSQSHEYIQTTLVSFRDHCLHFTILSVTSFFSHKGKLGVTVIICWFSHLFFHEFLSKRHWTYHKDSLLQGYWALHWCFPSWDPDHMGSSPVWAAFWLHRFFTKKKERKEPCWVLHTQFACYLSKPRTRTILKTPSIIQKIIKRKYYSLDTKWFNEITYIYWAHMHINIFSLYIWICEFKMLSSMFLKSTCFIFIFQGNFFMWILRFPA